MLHLLYDPYKFVAVCGFFKVSTKGLDQHPEFNNLPEGFIEVYRPHLQGVLRK